MAMISRLRNLVDAALIEPGPIKLVETLNVLQIPFAQEMEQWLKGNIVAVPCVFQFGLELTEELLMCFAMFMQARETLLLE